MKISARNCIEGKVVAIHDGPVSTEVTVATLLFIVSLLSKATQIGVSKGEIQSSQHQQPRAFCCLQTQDKKRRA